jgi:hypothetical protein
MTHHHVIGCDAGQQQWGVGRRGVQQLGLATALKLLLLLRLLLRLLMARLAVGVLLLHVLPAVPGACLLLQALTR